MMEFLGWGYLKFDILKVCLDINYKKYWNTTSTKNHQLSFPGIKMMYHHYKSTKEEEINEIRAKLYGEDFDHVNSRRNEPV